jgi:hypothetical protein
LLDPIQLSFEGTGFGGGFSAAFPSCLLNDSSKTSIGSAILAALARRN